MANGLTLHRADGEAGRPVEALVRRLLVKVPSSELDPELFARRHQTRVSVPCPVALNTELVSAVATPLGPTVNLTSAG
jgi:hypothetical protein